MSANSYRSGRESPVLRIVARAMSSTLGRRRVDLASPFFSWPRLRLRGCGAGPKARLERSGADRRSGWVRNEVGDKRTQGPGHLPGPTNMAVMTRGNAEMVCGLRVVAKLRGKESEWGGVHGEGH